MDHVVETRHLLEIWSQFPLGPNHGISRVELLAFEHRIGLKFPAVWREWLSEFGRHPLVLGSDDQGDGFIPLESMERCFSSGTPNVYSIACEAQENWSWGIRPQDLADSDPEIWMDREAAWMVREFDMKGGREVDGLVGTRCHLSQFLVGFLVRTIPFQAFSRSREMLKQGVVFQRIENDGIADELIERFDLSTVLGEPAAMGWEPFSNSAKDIILIRQWGVTSVDHDVALVS